MRNRVRRVISSSLLGLVAGSACLAGASPAAADPLSPLPLFALSCEQDVVGFKGQPVVLARLAVNGMVTEAVADTPGLGALAATAVGLTFPLGIGIEVGAVPDGTGRITPQAIADAVVAQVRPMREVRGAADAVAARVAEQVVAGCGMTVRALNPSVPTTPPPAPPTTPEPPAQQPTTPPPGTPVGEATPLPPVRFTPPQPSTGTAPPRDYGAVPYASPGGVYRPSAVTGSGVPGYAPQFGILGQDSGGVDVRTAAGDAQALPAFGRTGGVGVPIVLAALFLSVVTGALVRTWVLRKS
ncbi:hypothetical protein L6E12_30715 [Actinokineospora sp. PR83]|uniref:hypothetical protein n=1 Tax=Actinokineospora sp. PR83 TaxID=2884908 RepID=UPI001F1F21C3|nr:hypothetical protein [Actinokineospora sp. PR83]MCG8920153.1 hypothetical protein [Actinokineospora sp. PR83]